MPQIAVRLSDAEVELLDRLVVEEHFASRAAVIRDALGRLAKEREDREIAQEYRRAYERVPVTQEEIDWGIAGTVLLAESTQDGPAWEFDDDDGLSGPTIERLERIAEQISRIVREIVAQRERRA